MITKKFFSFFNFLFIHCYQFIEVLIQFCTNGIGIIIEVTSLVLTLLIVLKSIVFKIRPIDLTNMDSFYKASLIVDNYFLVTAFCLFLLFLRVPKYLALDSNIEFFINIARKATLDILFFLMMYVTILVGFSLMGFLMLGHYTPDYRDFEHSFITCYLIKFGTFSFANYEEADPKLGIVFLILYIIVMIFFLS